MSCRLSAPRLPCDASRHFTRHCSRAARGFTLIELLVAISILAIIAVLGWRGLDSIVRSRVALTQELEQTRGIQLAFAQLQSDCAQIAQPIDVGGQQTLSLEPQRITLIRSMHAENQPSRMQVVSYWLRDGQLTRYESLGTRDLSELNAMWQAALNDSNAAAATGVPLRNDVAGMTVSSWYSDQPGWRLAGAATAPGQSGAGSANNGSNAGNAANIGAPGTVMPTGLQVGLQLQGRDPANSMTKIFLLGAA